MWIIRPCFRPSVVRVVRGHGGCGARRAVAWRGAMATQALELHPPIRPSSFILHTCPSAAAWPGEEEPPAANNGEGLGWGRFWISVSRPRNAPGMPPRYQYCVPGMRKVLCPRNAEGRLVRLSGRSIRLSGRSVRLSGSSIQGAQHTRAAHARNAPDAG